MVVINEFLWCAEPLRFVSRFIFQRVALMKRRMDEQWISNEHRRNKKQNTISSTLSKTSDSDEEVVCGVVVVPMQKVPASVGCPAVRSRIPQ